MKRILFIFLLCFSIEGKSQQLPCLSSANKRAIKSYDLALKLYRSKGDRKLIYEKCEQSLEEDSAFVPPLLLVSECALKFKDDSKFMWAYEKLINVCAEADTNVHFEAAEFYFRNEDYKRASELYKVYLEFASVREEQNLTAELKLYRCQLILDPVQFDPLPIDSITTINPEYLPAISPDDEWFYFTRRFDEKPMNSFIPRNVEKLMMASHKSGVFSSAQSMGKPFNMTNNNNEGGPSLSIDNKRMFFTINKDGNFDIYMSMQYDHQKWTQPENLGEQINDPVQWDSQPSIAPDGKTLYFTSYRDSVNGTSDIFFSVQKTDGTWSKAKALPSPVNTIGNEKSPFIHPDGSTLYFASDGHKGMGGFDIFVSKKDNQGNWSTPKNIGYPINTFDDEVSLIVSTSGSRAYFASNKIKKSAGYNIYSFSLDDRIKPQKVLFVKGELKDQFNSVPMASKIELKNVNTNEVINVSYDTLSGRYASVVLFDSDYLLSVKKDSAAFEAHYLSKSDTSLQAPVNVDLKVKKIEKGSSFSFNNVLFETNSAQLGKEAKVLIRSFAEFMISNANLIIEIAGHTDNQGNSSDNQQLSELRANSVKQFLMDCGISSKRLLSKGYGMSRPIETNDSEEHRSLNRRTEFIIVSK